MNDISKGAKMCLEQSRSPQREENVERTTDKPSRGAIVYRCSPSLFVFPSIQHLDLLLFGDWLTWGQ
jgi:hypothetical protein